MTPLSQTLNALIGYAESLMAAPRYSAARNAMDFPSIAADVRAAEARPAEGERATRAAIVMVTAIEAYYATNGEPGSPWLMLAGAALPLLRTEAWVQLRNEREARHEPTRR